MDKIDLAIDPKFGEEPFSPFDLWEGANFRLKIRKVDGNTNYDLSDFAEPSQLLETDKQMEEVYNQLHSLQEFHAADKFKEYDDIKKRLYLITGRQDELSSGKLPAAEEPKVESGLPETEIEDIPVDLGSSAETKSSEPEEDEDFEYFQDLLESSN